MYTFYVYMLRLLYKIYDQDVILFMKHFELQTFEAIALINIDKYCTYKNIARTIGKRYTSM